MAVESPYKTLLDIRDAVIIDSKAGATTNTSLQIQVDRFINQGYQDVIVRRKREFLDDDNFFVTDDNISGDTTVTNGSTTVTFTTSTTLVSTTGYKYKFYAASTDEVYDITSIGTSTVTLASAYAGTTNTATTGNIVQSGLTLAAKVKTVYGLDHDKSRRVVTMRGRSSFDEQSQRSVQRQGKAEIATVSGVNTSAEKILLFYPYADSKYTLKVHVSNYFDELTSSSSEPLIPTEYRQILYWYALARIYTSVARNVDLFKEAQGQYQNWLGRLDTEIAPAQDEPGLVYDRNIAVNRSGKIFRNENREFSS